MLSPVARVLSMYARAVIMVITVVIIFMVRVSSSRLPFQRCFSVFFGSGDHTG